MGRDSDFSYEALDALYKHLSESEFNMGIHRHLDVVAICSQYEEIDDTRPEYADYIGDDATKRDSLLAKLPCSILVIKD
jgi:hypothetical protein